MQRMILFLLGLFLEELLKVKAKLKDYIQNQRLQFPISYILRNSGSSSGMKNFLIVSYIRFQNGLRHTLKILQHFLQDF